MLSEKAKVEQKQEGTGRDSGKYVTRGCKSMLCEKSTVFWVYRMKVDDFNFNPPKNWEQDRRVQPGIKP